MLKHSPIVFKEIRNNKRNMTLLSHSITSKDLIGSAKQFSKTRSNKQIDLTSFIENKNQKIKNIDVKLEVHQNEISKNTQIIEELNFNFLNLKEHLQKQKQLTQNEQRKNKLLKEEIQRTNKILRSKNSKIQQCTKKIADLEKDNEVLKQACVKNQEYAKTINNLRGKIATTEESMSDLKQSLLQKQKDIQKQKEKLSTLDILKTKQEELNSQILMKDLQIGNLKQTLNELQMDKSRDSTQKNNYEKKIEKLTDEINSFKQNQAAANKKYAELQKKFSQTKLKCDQLQSNWKQFDSKIKDKEKNQSNLKHQSQQLKQKLNTISNQLEEKSKEISKRDTKIQKLTQKVKQLQNNIGQTYKQKEKLHNLQQKIGLLKKRADGLQHVYFSIIPQIQCPFGHQLNNPVTIIPCGHNYCLGCKKGYQKQCMQCNGKLKIEAVYRNQLMDDIIGMVGGIKNVIEILK